MSCAQPPHHWFAEGERPGRIHRLASACGRGRRGNRRCSGTCSHDDPSHFGLAVWL